MALGIYLNFEKEAKEVISFYEQVFGVKCSDMSTFGDMPPSDEFPVSDDIKGLVMNASLTIEGAKIMFSDTPPSTGQTVRMGNNISIILELEDEEKLTRQFNDLAREGHAVMPLGETFWAKKYGFVIDKYGIGWQLSLLG